MCEPGLRSDPFKVVGANEPSVLGYLCWQTAVKTFVTVYLEAVNPLLENKKSFKKQLKCI